MRVFLIQQRQLEDLGEQNRILSVSIQRIDKKKWMPLFEVVGADGKNATCSVRVQSSEEVRTWADLRLLAEWLREKLGIEECQLILTQLDLFETPEIGVKNEHF